MGQKDIFERELTKNLVVIADLLNLILFGGLEVILPCDLQILPGDQAYFDSNDNLRELRRDRYVLWTKGDVIFAFFGLESQTVIDPDMPLRGFAYDGNSYREQLSNPDGKRYPVLTFVLYFGEKPWTKNLTLSERLQFTPEHADAFKPYFNDYHVNVIDVRRLKPEDVKKLRSVLRVIATYFYGLDHLDEDVPLPPVDTKENGMLLALFCKAYLGAEQIDRIPLDKLEKGECTMSEFIATLMEQQLNTGVALGRGQGIVIGRGEGIAIGREEGIVIGREEGREEGIVIGREEGVAIGRQQGLDEGLEQGVKREKQETALRMSELGFTLEQIAKAVKTDPAVVESWIAER